MKVYVVTHKPFDGRLPEHYEYIQVNAAKSTHFCALTDDTGDNISEKNPYYCELTAAYWIWKNDHENDIVGLAHYRRFLTTAPLSSSPKHYLNEKKVTKLLKKYDFISTRLFHFDCTVKEQVAENVHEHDFDLLRETVIEICPEYLQTYDNVMNGKETYFYNMFFCKKELWDQYHTWLFSLLFALEPKVDMTGYSVQEQRLYGFLSERLFTVYVLHHHLKVKRYFEHTVGVSKWKKITEKLKRIFHIHTSRSE